MFMMARRDCVGFTLVEVLASLLVFSLVTLGLVPLLGASLRGSNRSRAFTVSKNVATEAMERVRGLPYFIDHEAAAGRDLDVLDLYHPGLPNSGDFYVIDCLATPASRACPADLPDFPSDLGVTFRARFVGSDGTVTEPTPSNYDSDPDLAGETDTPPSLVLEVTVATSWTVLNAGDPDTFELKTLLGERPAGDTKVSAVGRVDYGIRALTSYTTGTGSTGLTVLGGISDSRIRTRTGFSATHTTRTATLRVLDNASPDAPPLAEADPASVEAAAPPDVNPAAVFGLASSVSVTGLGPVASVDASTAGPVAPVEADVRALASVTALESQGGFVYESGSVEELVVDKPEVATGTNTTHLLASPRLLSLQADSLGSGLLGFTRASTDPTFDTSAVASRARVDLGQLRLLPSTFVTDPSFGGAAVVLSDFVAEVNCDTAAGAAVPSATATWSARLRYWRESDPNDNKTAGAYVDAGVITSDSATTTLISGLKSTPPMLAETKETLAKNKKPSLLATDVYLFPNGGNPAYLSDMRTRSVLGASSDVRTATASVNSAIDIDTVPFPSSAGSPYTPTALNVSLGALSCQAEDRR